MRNIRVNDERCSACDRHSNDTSVFKYEFGMKSKLWNYRENCYIPNPDYIYAILCKTDINKLNEIWRANDDLTPTQALRALLAYRAEHPIKAGHTIPRKKTDELKAKFRKDLSHSPVCPECGNERELVNPFLLIYKCNNTLCPSNLELK